MKIWQLLIGCILFASCGDCFTSTGEQSSEVRYPGRFTRLEIRDNIEVVIVPSTIQTGKVVLRCGKNLLKGVQTILKDSVLELKNTNRCNWVRSYAQNIVAEVYMDTILDIAHWGIKPLTNKDSLRLGFLNIVNYRAADIRLNIGFIDNLYVNSYATGAITFKGYCGVLEGNLYGIGKIDASQLETGFVYFSNYSINDASFKPEKEMGVHIKNSGNVWYYRNPIHLIQTIEGTGRVIPKF